MGCRSTKVAVSHVKAVASPVAPAPQHQRSKQTNDPRPCQDQESQPAQTILNLSQSRDDINLEPSNRNSTTPGRRYSEPADTAAMATEPNAHGVQHLDAFESFVAERNIMAIDLINEVVASFDAIIPAQEKTSPPEEPDINCVACCAPLPKETDAKFSKEAIRPCRSCSSAYCRSCIRNMFLDACKDFSRMPARCCTQIHLHYVKSHLTADEIAKYKSKYEEWSTPKPFYCPIPTCSVFIPERLLPQPENRVDSGVGTPVSTNFSCPKCERGICFDCRQSAHSGSLCATLDLGVDAETAALLKAWGYKRCPRCSQGLKRMYGCSHMECLCGAHFCWGCLKSRDDCDGGCPEDDDEDDDDANESDFEPAEPEPLHDPENSILVNRAEGDEATTQATEQDATDASTTPRPTFRPRNLDGGSARYWEDQDLDFGREPTGGSDLTWSCYHSFEPFAISLAKAMSIPTATHEAECVKCWCVIQPDIEASETTNSTAATRKPLRTPTIRVRGGRRGRGRGAVGRHRPTVYTPPRGLGRSDATVGTAPHLNIQLAPANPRLVNARPEPMEGLRSQLKADLDQNETAPESKSAASTSNVFSGTLKAYSVAQECHRCSLLVCTACADAIITRQEANQAAETKSEAGNQEEAQPEETTDSEDEPHRPCQVLVPPDSDFVNEDPSPSLFH